MPKLGLTDTFVRAMRDGILTDAEKRDLETSLKAVPKNKRHEAARLIGLVTHDHELSHDELKAAQQLLGKVGGCSHCHTKALAARPQCNVGFSHFSLELDLRKEPAPARIDYTIHKGSDGNAILEASSERLHIKSVSINGRNVDATHEGNRLVLAERVAKGDKLSIDYEVSTAKKGASGYGLIEARGTTLALLWPEHFSMLAPGDGRPGKKLTADLKIRVPKDTVVAAAGKRIAEKDGVVHHRIETAVPQYAVSFAATRGGEVVEDPHSDMVFIGTQAPSAKKRREGMLEVARHTLSFMKSWFGPSPTGTVHQIVEVPGALGGMEIAQSIQVSRAYTKTLSEGAEVVAHEVIHHWFGNGVRVKREADLWLSEGFTTYLTWRAEEAREGKGRWLELASAGIDAARGDLKARRKSHEQYALRPAFDHVAIESIFDSVSYEYGAVVLAALEEKLGRERFDQLMRGWFRHAVGKAVDTDDFFRYVGEHTELNVLAFRRRWVDKLPTEARFERFATRMLDLAT